MTVEEEGGRILAQVRRCVQEPERTGTEERHDAIL